MFAGRPLARSALAVMLMAGAAAAAVAATSVPAVAQQSEIRAVVNREAITSYQIQQRAAFLRLRRAPASNEAALNELIDETVKKQEIRRRGINIPDSAVDDAFANFAQQNRMQPAQLNQLLSQAGFSQDGFKDYIRTQMGWGQAVQANVRQTERLSEQDAVQRMLQQGGDKPSTTEYTLQQVILVVPAAERSRALDRRMQEANALRQRFTTCPATYQYAQGLRDVTVRDLGRVTEPELPPNWKDDIVSLQPGRTTRAQATERGVEFIGICDARTVSDDRSATLVLEARDLEALNNSEPDIAFLNQLKERATIIRR
ncbi:peptidylprolyl isomerase [Aureimonas mangrovi]|uniref:SurA N-terminal domain-containing protein n=1 Tax=Aureimonas mangrovi TaxID=2758041 RepID=UPI00163D4A7E|nr:peptidylprolyl isomerase [Aureimonas mangrovi]